jgi:hypothetical protein
LRGYLDQNPVAGELRSGARRFWTTREEKILRESYPAGGVPVCVPLLPGRTASSIYNRANLLKLRSPFSGGHNFREKRWASNDHIDAAIRRTYEAKPEKRAILKLAATLQRPRWWVSKRAARLGLVQPRFKAPPWTQAENAVLAEYGTIGLHALRKRLKRAGYTRTETAIAVQLKRLHITRKDPDRSSARAFSELMGVDIKTVTRWIDSGWLLAKGKDPYIITRPAARRFIGENAAAVDLRKVDKEWFIDLLLERGGA